MCMRCGRSNKRVPEIKKSSLSMTVVCIEISDFRLKLIQPEVSLVTNVQEGVFTNSPTQWRSGNGKFTDSTTSSSVTDLVSSGKYCVPREA